jgi:hypothetical protein
MAAFTDNPFAVLSFIAAPAVMTNASSILVLSTSNRLARAIDQTRAVIARIDAKDAAHEAAVKEHLIRLHRLGERTTALRKALSCFYLSIGSFATASLTSVLGAGSASFEQHLILNVCLVIALIVGLIGVSSLVYGCLMLVNETRFALVNLDDEAQSVRAEAQRKFNLPPTKNP